jgi:hypothetical protein
LVVVLGVLGGMVLGNLGPTDQNFAMGNFLATRPMSTTALARALLTTCGQSVFLTWLLWAAVCLAAYGLVVASGEEPHMGMIFKSWRYYLAILLGLWIVATMFASMLWTGRREFFLWVFVGGVASIIAAAVGSGLLLTPTARTALSRGLLLTASAAGIVVTIWAMFESMRRSLIGWPTACTGAIAWAILAVVFLSDASLPKSGIWTMQAFILGAAALAVAPLATAPLALHWNRHR